MAAFGATNKPDTCLWCGRRFPPETKHVRLPKQSPCCIAPVEPWQETVDRWGGPHEVTWYRCTKCGNDKAGFHQPVRYDKTGRRIGYAGSGHFCTRTCGYHFAEAMAGLGHRLKARPKTPSEERDEILEAVKHSIRRYVDRRFGEGTKFEFQVDGLFKGHNTVNVVRIWVNGKRYTRSVRW